MPLPTFRNFTRAFTLTLLAALPSCLGGPPDLARFDNDIRAFEAADKKSPPPQNATLFIGSSTFTKWKNIEKDFPGLAVFNRGFGGSTMAEVNHYLNRIVLPYKPKQIVVYEGTNDIAAGLTADQVFADMKDFCEKVHAALPDTQIFFLPIIPAPSRAKLAPEMDRANALLAEYVARHPEFHYIDDARYLWSDAKKQPDEKLYIFDRLHPSREAYEKLIPIIRKAIEPPATQPAK